MKHTIQLLLLMSAMVLLSSCGIITKTRYGNGLKLNLGERFRKEERQSNVRVKQKPERRLVFRPVSEAETLALPQQAPEKTVLSAAPGKALKRIKHSGKAGSTSHHDIHHSAPEKTISKTAQGVQNYRVPIEPNVRIAAWLYYGGLAVSYLLGSMSAAVSAIAGIAVLAGFVLAWVGLSNIRDSGGAYRGKGIAISIIVLTIISIIYLMLLILLLAAIFV